MKIFSYNTIVVGSGAAGFNAADRLYDFGSRNVAIVTEGINMGTSRNTGSDKQTYYKLTLAGGVGDSVIEMARTLFDGGCMHGDMALCEAALSTRCFCKLADIGVPFPHNQYGEYVGYKTDHDPRQRATSAGPLTSRFMTEKLEKQVMAKNIPIFDGYKIISIITDKGKCVGLLALDKNALNDSEKMFVLFNCTNVIMATGGPAGLYSCSVYPESQTGSNGIAFEAGVAGRNLTEWQYGIASVKFRWNLSGSYQQVIPRYVSTDQDGNDPCEFLDNSFPDAQTMLNAIFLKGYQWPFDSRKIANHGSSLVDILVHQEVHKRQRRVFLDFMHNPLALQHDLSNLGKEPYAYLKQSGAFQSTPIERLAHINKPAIDLYRSNGIDLSGEMLEIAVCAQHNNGGLAVNSWWETNVAHLFAVGEAAGTHGVYRPGGSALNAGQAGSTRAAMFIAKNYMEAPMQEDDFKRIAKIAISKKLELARTFLENKNGLSPQAIRAQLGNRMSAFAAHIRYPDQISKICDQALMKLKNLAEQTVLAIPQDIVTAFENVDLLIAQHVYAAAMENYITQGGGSRGSFIIKETVDDTYQNINGACNEDKFSKKVQNVYYSQQGCDFCWEDVRKIPENDDWFENVWRECRKSC